MATQTLRNHHTPMFQVHDSSIGHSRWMLAMGIALIVLGAIAMVTAVVTTLVSVLFLGALFLLAAIFQTVFAMTAGRWAGFGLHLLLAVLYGISGVFLLMSPAIGAATLTLLLACFFVVSGMFRLVGSAMLRFSGWGWAFFSGVLTTGLGIFVILNLPAATMFLLGLLLALDLIFIGATLTSFGIALRRGQSDRISRSFA